MTHPQLLLLEQHSESYDISPMPECVQAWLLSTAVPDKSGRTVLYFVKQGEVFVGRSPQARKEYSSEERTCALYMVSMPRLTGSHVILLKTASFPEACLASRSRWDLKVNVLSHVTLNTLTSSLGVSVSPLKLRPRAVFVLGTWINCVL